MRKYGNGGETDPKKLTPAQWKAKNKSLGYLPVNGPRPSPHGEFYDPNKWYQTIDDKGNIIDLPYESYTNPTQKPAIDPNRKSLDLSNPSFKYDPNLGRYFNNVTGDEIKPIVEQYKKGGKIKGYAEGGTTNYSERFKSVNTVNELNQAQNTQATQPNPYTKNNTGAQVKGAATGALGAYGTGYFAAQTANPETSSWRTAGLTGVSQAGPIGAVIGGVAGIGDQIGKPIKAKNERMDAEGNLIDPESARRGAILGGLLSPSKALETRMSYKGGFTDLTGKGYTNSLEAKEKERLANIYNQENQIKLDNQKLQFNALAQDNLLKRDAGITGNTHKDGGEIKGKGTGTSDSITAKVEAGSFIVPEHNSFQAKLIRKQILGKSPNKTANLNQFGGTTVKLSAGEEMFTPEESKIITEAGYDLNKLAPDAKDKLRAELKNGGTVKCMAKGGTVGDDDYKKAQAKADAKYEANKKKLGEARAKVIRDKDYNDLRYNIYKQLEKRTTDKKDYQKSVTDTQRELDALKQSYKLFDEQSNAALNTPTTEAEKLAGANSKPNVEDVRKNREELLNKIKDKEDALAQAKTKLDFANNEKNYINDVSLRLGNTKKGVDPYGVVKQTATPVTTATTDPLADPALVEELGKMDSPAVTKTAPVATTNNILESIRPKTLSVDDTEGMTAPSAQSVAQGNVPQNTSQSTQVTEPLSTTPSTNPSPSAPTGARQGFNVGNGFGTALTYGIPLAQTIIGLDQLKKAGDRPIDRINQDVLSAVDKTKKNALQAEMNAQFGMTANERAQLRMQNNGLLNTERYNARNLSGGSSAAALNYERAAVNDSFGRTLSAKIYDDKLKQQKQQIAYGLQDAVNNSVAHKQELNRRLFADTMGAWQQRTGAAANLSATGLGNLYDSISANNRLNRFNEGYNNANGI